MRQRLYASLFVLLLVLVPTSASAVGNEDPGGDTSPGTYIYEFNESDVRIEPQGEFESVKLRHPGTIMDDDGTRIGHPALPVVTKWFVLPPGTTISDVSISERGWTTISGSYHLSPIEGDVTTDQSPEGESPELDTEVYNSDTEYPPRPVYVSFNGYRRHVRLACVCFYPVRYTPSEGTLRMAEEVTIEYSATPLSYVEDKEQRPLARRDYVGPHDWIQLDLIASLVENPDDVDRWYRRSELRQEATSTPFGAIPSQWPSLESPPVDEIIITDSKTLAGESVGDLTGVFEDYADWKDGWMQTEVRTVSDIVGHYPAGDAVESIRAFVLDAIENWNTSYVLLGGDVDIVPTRRLGGTATGNNSGAIARVDPVADVYYVRFGDADAWNLDGDAYYWESGSPADATISGPSSDFLQAALGRVPCKGYATGHAVVDKLIAYQEEAGTPGGSFYESALLAAGPTSSFHAPRPGVLNESNGYSIAESLAVVLDDEGWDVTRLYGLIDVVHSEPCPPAGSVACFDSLSGWMSDVVANEVVVNWLGDGLRDEIQTGYHLVYHVEHSERDQLGRPRVWSGGVEAPEDIVPTCLDARNWKDTCLDWLEPYWKSRIEPLTREQAFGLTNGTSGRFSVVMSSGSHTNMWDMHAIGEDFLLAPDGGAIAYIGKTPSAGGTEATVFAETIKRLTGAGPVIGWAFVDGALSARGNNVDQATRQLVELNLLGDPAFTMFQYAPSTLDVTVDPDTVSSLGSVAMSVEVRDGAFAVKGARVTIQQGGSLYASKTVGAGGAAHFDGLSVANSGDLVVTVTQPYYKVTRDTISVSGPGFLAYDSHTIDDAAPGGDEDGVLEAGETARIRAVFRNQGDSTAGRPSLYLRPTPPLFFDVGFSGDPAPEKVFVGRDGAKPNPDTETFRVPAPWDGMLADGAPSTGGVSDDHLRIYRDETTGTYRVEFRSTSASSDSVFTGSITTTGGFDSVSLTGEGGDTYYASGDSIWFYLEGDASLDVLSFTANASSFLELTPPASPPTWPSGIASGDTCSYWFDVEIAPETPDGYELEFTSTAKHSVSVWNSTYLSAPLGAPEARLMALDVIWGDFVAGQDTSVALVPSIQNIGSDDADSLVLVLHQTGGTGVITDSTAVFTAIAPGVFAAAEDSFVIGGSSVSAITSFESDLEVEIYYISTYEKADLGEVGGGHLYVPIPAPDNIAVNAIGRGFDITWDPVEWDEGENTERAAYYLVYSADGGLKRFVGRSDGTSRAMITHDANGVRYEPLDGNGDPVEHSFVVRACLDGKCSPFSATTAPQMTWLPEATGWPKLVAGSTLTAPKIVTIDERDAVFVADRDIYAWFLDTGEPVVDGNDDGLFFSPSDATVDVRERFVETLAHVTFDIPTPYERKQLIVGNRAGDGLYAVEIIEDNGSYSSSLYWKKDGVTSDLSAPLVLRMKASDSAPTIVFNGSAASTADPDTLFAFHPTGYPYLTPVPTGYRPGTFSVVPDYVKCGACCYGGTECVVETKELCEANGGTFLGGACEADGSCPGTSSIQTQASSGNWRSLAVIPNGLLGVSARDLHLVQSTRDGRVLLWDNSWTSGQLADTLWTRHLSCSGVSSPSTGEVVTGNDDYEIVVTNVAGGSGGKVWSLAFSDGSTLIEREELPGATWRFTAADGGPAPRPSLACLEEASYVSIIAGGTGPNNLQHEVHLFEVDQAQDTLRVATLSDTPIVPSRGDQAGPTKLWMESVVFNIDGDSDWDVLSPAQTQGLYAWSLADSLPRQGWPILGEDFPSTPAVTDDGIVVSDYHGRVHYFQLPADGYADPDGWREYAGDWMRYDSSGIWEYGEACNWGFHPPCSVTPPLTEDTRHVTVAGKAQFVGLRSAGMKPPHEIRFDVPSRGPVDLAVFDVQGRRVRRLLDAASVEPGLYQLSWDGVTDAGRAAPSGVYFYRLENEHGQDVIKTVMLR